MSIGGMSTRTVGGPIGMTGQYGGRQPGSQIVPLSVFFLRMQGKDIETEGDGEKRKKKCKRRRSDDREAMGQNDQATIGGGRDQVDGDGSASGQEPAAEAVTAASGGPSKAGATRISGGTMGSGNVAAYPVPLGVPLRREVPWVAGKKKRKTKEQKRELIGRLLAVG